VKIRKIRDKRMNWDRLTSVILLVGCGVLWYQAVPYSNLASFFPRVAIVALAVFSAVLLVKSWIKPERKKLFPGIEKRYVGVTLGIIALWIGWMTSLGFYVSSILFFNLLVWLISRKKRSLRSIAFSFAVVVATVSFFYLVFREILLVPLPQGIFF
jgi:putative tricarboxylic transport membrane protein